MRRYLAARACIIALFIVILSGCRELPPTRQLTPTFSPAPVTGLP
ncbi:MAG TPA: hypothetical protein VMZ24_00470 [Patescibacteria group bacterium]|nr:hypothetical protein [Patescibacteria group bacterium]